MGAVSTITTFTKIKMSPFHPRCEDICIEDIAHALSLVCRANGHFKQFFSVAQHSINCAKEAAARGLSSKVQLACLLHDSSEAYISDITRPVKQAFPEYVSCEDKLQGLIWDHFLKEQLTEEEIGQVYSIDDAQLYHEFLYFMGEEVFDYQPILFNTPDFNFNDFSKTEKEFLVLYNRLVNGENSHLCVGIDGCKGKWLSVAIDGDAYEVNKFNSIHEICNAYGNAASMLIDIPIGLPMTKSEADMRPDQMLRRLMKGKASSVFSVPCRQAIYEDDQGKARKENLAALGRSLSAQSLGICKAIRQVDAFLQENPIWKGRLLESHPEYAFTVLNGGNAIIEKKTEAVGQKKRIDLLRKHYNQSEVIINEFLSGVNGRKKIDDVIDALSLAVTGQLGIARGFRSIPEVVERDSTGLEMQIVVADI